MPIPLSILKFGTGCVKVTPAHDPNDFEIGTVHDLEKVNIFNDDGTLNENVPQQFQQLDRFEAREKVVKALEELGCVEKVDPYVTSIGYSDRGQVPIEPYLSEQWFMRMSELAKPALEAVRNGDITFHPKHWTKNLRALDGEYTRLVHQPAVVVGTQNSCLVPQRNRRSLLWS